MFHKYGIFQQIHKIILNRNSLYRIQETVATAVISAETGADISENSSLYIRNRSKYIRNRS